MVKRTTALFSMVFFSCLLACGDDNGDSSSGADASGSGDTMDSSAMSAEDGTGANDGDGDPGDGDGDPGDGDPGDGDPGDGDGDPGCEGQHPEVEDDQRFCLDGWCGCGLGEPDLDVCYPEGVAEACCPEGAVLACPAPKCEGMHPIVEGDNRYCMMGWCGCGLGMQGYDACYPQETAEYCCDDNVPLECF